MESFSEMKSFSMARLLQIMNARMALIGNDWRSTDVIGRWFFLKEILGLYSYLLVVKMKKVHKRAKCEAITKCQSGS